MRQNITQDVVQLQLSAADAAGGADPDIDYAGIPELSERLRGIPDAILKGDLMDGAENDLLPTREIREQLSLFGRIDQGLLDQSMYSGFDRTARKSGVG
jgi:hypothetical protein